ncbi:HAMP domain-containing histidine kinase [Polycladomyces sp. WAk]|uniref:histidine kinase n=1 Tax=Polycladomyces zharkentensis TaxID=2807616 RepID=A0ABS2WLW8_9BACL|nr:HAMP domain-containing sensor histidine kinase [Polycladomyces sp. WAk]MBN2910552.1 HAMP domain-containing histidine kinase [Polycladomyces sp. WAk]
MDLRRRLAWQLLSRIIILFSLLLIIAFVSSWMIQALLDSENSSEVRLDHTVKTIVKSTQIRNGTVTINPDTEKLLAREQMWIQILNSHGHEIYQFHRPLDRTSSHYTPGEFYSLMKELEKDDDIVSIVNKHINHEKITWVIGGKVHQTGVPFVYQVQYMVTTVLCSFLAAILISVLFGKRLGNPLIHILLWIKNLADKTYQEPLDQYGRPASLNKRNGLKKNFRLYKEVIQALNQLTNTLRQSEEDRLRLEKTREDWIVGVTHDFKTPLSTIKGYVDVLSSDRYQWSEEDIRNIAAILQERIQYMEDLINDFSLAFQLKNQSLVLHKEVVDIVELCREATITIANLPQSDHKELVFRSNVTSLRYHLDKHWFKRILENIIANAVNHNPDGTKIEVLVEALSVSKTNDPRVQIVISDNGVGMDEETQARLFERYYRGVDSNTSHRGTGLGMAISYQLILAHKGWISVDSKPNEGTVVRIFLP